MTYNELDEVERFVHDTKLCCAVLANRAGECLLIPLDRPLLDGEQMKARLGDFGFVGVYGMTASGHIDHLTEIYSVAAERIMRSALPAYRAHLDACELAAPVGDGVDFLEALYRLEDPRQ